MTAYLVEIRQQARQSLALRLTPRGVLVLIPYDLEIDSQRVEEFIETGLDKLACPPSGNDTNMLSTQELNWMIREWENRLGVRVARQRIQPMSNKWASCSTNGVLTLSDDLYLLPRDLVEFVICHELLHLRIPDHGRGFQAMMTAYLPDWRRRERELMSYTYRESSGR